jgi:hypothetical protein
VSDNMKLGTSYGALAYLSTFFNDSRDREPRCLPIVYAAYVDVGDGSRPGSGWMTQKWVWSRLTEHYWDHIMSFRNSAVYVLTRKNDGTFGYYTAILIGPDEEPEHFAGRVLGAEITLRAMVVYTP